MFNEDLFNDEKLNQQNDFLNKNSSNAGKDGLYRVDLNKVSKENEKRGYKAIIRFLPNFTNNPDYVKAYLGEKWTEGAKTAIGPNGIEKKTHYLKIDNMPDVKGYYDDPKNINYKTGKPFSDSSPLAETYFALVDSNDAISEARAEMINYQRKYFSYVLVIEDEQQPELEGKIMVFSYGKQISDKIEAEKEGHMGEKCNVFDLKNGKDLILLVKEKEIRKGVTVPDYTNSSFKQETSTISIPNSDGVLKNVPLNDEGDIPDKFKQKIANFLLEEREVELEDFAPKPWSDAQEIKVKKAIAFLTGKNTEAESSADDFSFDEVSEDGETTTSDSSDTSEKDEDFSFNEEMDADDIDNW